MYNWNDLRFFLAAARTGTIAGAAKALKVDQTTVGRRLAALEAALGTQLFTRTRDGLSLTDAGQRSLEMARDFDERAGNFEAAVSGRDRLPEGTVRVAMNENFSVGFFLERLIRVRDRHPGIALEVVTSQHAANLLRREADIAIRVAPRALPEQRGLIVRKLGALPLALYATKEYLDSRPPASVERRLEGHDVILYEQEIADAPPGRWLAEHATAARPVLTVNSLLGAAAAAAAGAGIALIPCFMTKHYSSLLRVGPAAPAGSDVWLLVHPELHATARVRVVVDHIVAEMEAAAAIVDPPA